MKKVCLVCKREKLLSKALGVCVDCLRRYPNKTQSLIEKAHTRSRAPFNLPAKVPKTSGGVTCPICVNRCQIGEGELGYCGLRTNKNNRLVHLAGTVKSGIVHWYFDPLPTNCVADWVCPGGTGAGYPDYSYSKKTEYGYNNLAVFLGACSFNCLFCQNWSYREMASSLSPTRTPQQLAEVIDAQTSCICFFGGDPAPQMPYALAAAKTALQQRKNKILRICWETDGAMNERLAKRAAELSLQTGGCIKVDLKAYNEQLNIALTGVTNKQTLKNFVLFYQYAKQRAQPPFLIASTLLVPGYIEAEEVAKIAKFIAELDKNIPYALLAFYPTFFMNDLPTTSWRQAKECEQAALEAGLKRVRIGNVHLLH
jgi:pyruvate formate lyase activating enzyme